MPRTEQITDNVCESLDILNETLCDLVDAVKDLTAATCATELDIGQMLHELQKRDKP